MKSPACSFEIQVSIKAKTEQKLLNMEGNLPSGVMIQGSSYAMLDIENPMNNHTTCNHNHNENQNDTQHQSSMMNARQMNGYFPNTSNNAELSLMGKNPTSDEDDHFLTNDDEHNNHNGNVKGKRGFQRMKWTDVMIRLLITAVSYVGEDADCSSAAGRKLALLQKKGKWKSISKVLAERGCFVSPQQCEDKFNDLNKRYKRLTELLGRGTTCKVVENPALLDTMDNLSKKAKEDARKILSSKHLFYEEMCSYHNGNRFKLPPDPALQKSLQLALKNREHDNSDKRGVNDDHDDYENADSDDDLDGTKGLKIDNEDEQHMHNRRMQLKEQRLQIEAEMLELKHQKLEWLKISKEKDRELEDMKLEIKRMKLENERLAVELNQKGGLENHNH